MSSKNGNNDIKNLNDGHSKSSSYDSIDLAQLIINKDNMKKPSLNKKSILIREMDTKTFDKSLTIDKSFDNSPDKYKDNRRNSKKITIESSDESRLYVNSLSNTKISSPLKRTSHENTN